MTKVDEIKALLDEVTAEDVAEDAAFQAQIDALSTTNATLATERDAALAANISITTERDTLLAERSTIIADLIASRDSLSARITALGG